MKINVHTEFLSLRGAVNRIYLFGSKEIKDLLFRVIKKHNWKDKKVLDFPAGSGVTSTFLLDKGAQVTAVDIFPEFFKEKRITCQLGDLQQRFSFPDKEFDAAIFQEGIEHLPNQFFALQEFSRILKQEGRLFLTTPNYSNLRSRWAYLLFEAETPKMMPPNELESVWHGKEGRIYYGHIFSTGIMRLRLLAHLAGFKIEGIHPSRINLSSLLLGFLFFPFIVMTSFLVFRRALRKNSKNFQDGGSRIFKELLELNFHPNILLGGHLIIEFRKSSGKDLYETRSHEICET